MSRSTTEATVTMSLRDLIDRFAKEHGFTSWATPTIADPMLDTARITLQADPDDVMEMVKQRRTSSCAADHECG